VRRLLIRPGAIGDFIVSLPALECLRSEYTELWTAPATVPLGRFADRCRSIASTGLDLLEITGPAPELLDTLRGFDSIVSWYGANRAEFRDAVAALGLPFEFLRALPLEGDGRHACDFYLDQVRPFSAVASDAVPRLACPVPCRNFAAIHPFSGSPKKNWPLSYFRALAHDLERTLPVEWCSGPNDPPLDGALRIEDLWELAQWLASAEMYIGNDSGISHLAAAVGTPVLAFFGPTDPAVWAPRGPEVQIVRWGYS
jgi:hypothetical protein